MSFKVLTRSSVHASKYPFRTFMEFPTFEEALQTAVRLEENTELDVIVDMPSGSLWISNGVMHDISSSKELTRRAADIVRA